MANCPNIPIDAAYDEAIIQWPDSTLKAIIGYHDEGLRVVFVVWLRYSRPNHDDAIVIYKTWSRKKLHRVFDPDTMLQTPDLKLSKIADKLAKMGPKLFEIRLKTWEYQGKSNKSSN